MRLAAALLIALAAPAVAYASDAEVYERSIEEAGYVCPGHSVERTTPGVRAVPVGALRVLQKRGYLMCPDRRLDAATPVVWYPRYGVFAWNPEHPASVKAVAAKIDELTRSESFPTETSVWDAKGKALSGQTVPAFEPRPEAATRILIR
ncbi:hypothetical protein [Luteimonas aquatica]|uniref:hypothetical protein n=1 Tax=Luteimonas aquatica TaxID=450364 RepID=UPI001F58DAD7|nr:hypothetical protein [Luteimonas aquatica]